MGNSDLILLLLLCSGTALLVLAAVIKYFVDFCDEIKYVKMKMNRSHSWDEYVHWKHELFALRCSIIPGLTPYRVKAIKRFFCRDKHAKKREKSDGFISLLMPSILGIAICAVCLAGGTFAWFNASESTGTSNIQAASYTVATEISAEDGTPIVRDNTVTLQKGTYTVKLTANGDATTGYAVVTVGKTEIYRGQLKPVEAFSFTLVVNEAATLEITYQWGTAATQHSSIQDGTYIYGTAPAAEEEAPNDSNNSDQAVTEPDEETTLPTDEAQPT